MPGRNPAEAFRAFIEPLESAMSVLGPAKITVSPGGRNVPNKQHAWTLNNQRGYSSHGWHFEAQMMYQIIEDARPGYGPWRVTTKGYRYRLAVPTAREVFCMHWHPAGNSPVHAPHMHLALSPHDQMGDTLKKHLPTKRQTFEQAIRWAIELGLEPARDEWKELLEQAEQQHLKYRTWT